MPKRSPKKKKERQKRRDVTTKVEEVMKNCHYFKTLVEERAIRDFLMKRRDDIIEPSYLPRASENSATENSAPEENQS